MRKTAMLAALLGALAVAAGVPFATPAVGASPNLNPKVLPINSVPYGKTYGGWAAVWWQWAFSVPADVNPLFDETGANAAQGQTGHVWFLGGVFNESGTATRTVTVPAGKALFFPIVNYMWLSFPEDNPDPEAFPPDPPWDEPYTDPSGVEWATYEEYVRVGMLKPVIDSTTNLSCTIDGNSVENLAAYRCQSPTFMVDLPEKNIFGLPPYLWGPCADDGIYVFLAPPAVGKHTIQFTATLSNGFSLSITYYLTVKGGPR